MSFPKVTILYSTNNLLKDIAAVDGIAGIVATVDTPELIGVAKQVFSLADAVDKGITQADEPFMYAIVAEFYKEVGGNQELWLMGIAETMTMAQALDHSDETAAIKLTKAAEGKIRLLGVLRKPDGGYDGGADFFDSDVEAAVTAAQTFATAELAAARPLRILIEGRIMDEDSLTIYQPKDSNAGAAAVVLGSTVADGRQAVGLVLGRAVKYGAEVKIGKVANGPLNITAAYIGSKAIGEVVALETLHGKGIISFMKHPQKAGIYFGVDRMASTADDRLLAYGRVVDKAALITFATYVEELENEVDVDAEGKMAELDAKHLENVLEQQINVNMGNQISGVSVVIPRGQIIIPGNTVEVKLRVQPKGYNTFINVDLGLTASL